MTWNELNDILCEQCSKEALSCNIVTHFMEDDGAFDWRDECPKWAIDAMKVRRDTKVVNPGDSARREDMK